MYRNFRALSSSVKDHDRLTLPQMLVYLSQILLNVEFHEVELAQ
jgi:hypothetical protein